MASAMSHRSKRLAGLVRLSIASLAAKVRSVTFPNCCNSCISQCRKLLNGGWSNLWAMASACKSLLPRCRHSLCLNFCLTDVAIYLE